VTLRLYELAMADGSSTSPYVWRIRYALGHKGLPFEPVPTGFTGIPLLFGGAFKTVPILEDGNAVICDSFAIAEYLDRAYPDRPILFSSAGERAAIRFLDKWVVAVLVPLLAGICAPDIYHRVRPEDRAYFRETREARLGRTLEALAADREGRLPAFQAALQPLRLTLDGQQFLGGDRPGYADFIMAGLFIWAGQVATIPLLDTGDALLPWLTRCFDLYGGAGRVPALPALSVR
jgi:glutathione S-transferase